MIPPSWVPRGGRHAGENDAGSGIRAFWGQGCTRQSLPLSREKYCHNGGMAFARNAAPGPGAEGAMIAPSRGSLETALMQGKRCGVRDSRPLGAEMDSSASYFLHSREVLPQRVFLTRGSDSKGPHEVRA